MNIRIFPNYSLANETMQMKLCFNRDRSKDK